MKAELIVVLVLALAGCSTLRPVHGSAEELRAQLRAGTLLKAGDDARIVTDDGVKRELIVSAVTNERVEGKNASIPIADIVSIDKRRLSVGKNLLLLGAIGVGVLGYEGYSQTHGGHYCPNGQFYC